MTRSTLARREAMARLNSVSDSVRSCPAVLRRGVVRPVARVGGVGEAAGSAVGVQATLEPRGESAFLPGFGVVHRAWLRVTDQHEPAVGGADDLDVEPAAVAFSGVHAGGEGVFAAVAGRGQEPVHAHGRAQFPLARGARRPGSTPS